MTPTPPRPSIISPQQERLQFVRVKPAHLPQGFAEAVGEGLSAPRKHLPCRYFYDAAGSQLFERICALPEYYPTRTERAIIDRYSEEMVAAAGSGIAIVEFGSGSSAKTRLLLQAALHRQQALHYTPIDISAEFLRDSACTLLQEYAGLSITAIAAEYNDGIAAAPVHDGPRLFLFLGSNIGNFVREDAVAFLNRVHGGMEEHDRLLVGVDLVKDRRVLEAAYDDAQGVTAQFNKNLLLRVNQELDADFDLSAFDHAAPFIKDESRIEMHLVSRRPQTVRVGALNRTFEFAQDETIHTENSHKYSPDGFRAICGEAGFAEDRCWTDERGWFAMFLLKPAAG